MSRNSILSLVRVRALKALSDRDDRSWRRAVAILDREGRRIQRSYTAQREPANV